MNKIFSGKQIAFFALFEIFCFTLACLSLFLYNFTLFFLLFLVNLISSIYYQYSQNLTRINFLLLTFIFPLKLVFLYMIHSQTTLCKRLRDYIVENSKVPIKELCARFRISRERFVYTFYPVLLSLHPFMMNNMTIWSTEKTTHRSRYIPKSLREFVLNRDGHRCVRCGASGPDIPLHIDHIIPFSKGGKHSKENLQVLCANCNLLKLDSDPEDFEREYGEFTSSFYS